MKTRREFFKTLAGSMAVVEEFDGEGRVSLEKHVGHDWR